MFPGTFKKLLLKQKLQFYVVIGQKIQKLRGILDWKFLGMCIIRNFEISLKNECKNYMVMVYLHIFCFWKCSWEQNRNILKCSVRTEQYRTFFWCRTFCSDRTFGSDVPSYPVNDPIWKNLRHHNIEIKAKDISKL